MSNMDVWDWVLLAGGGYIAVVALVRLMRLRQEVVLDEISREIETERRRKEADKERERRQRKDQDRGRAA